MKSKIIMMSLFVPFLVSFSYSAIAQTENSGNEKAKEQEAARLKDKRIVAVDFVGNKIFSNEELLNSLQETNSKGEKVSAVIGVKYDAYWIDAYLQETLTAFLQNRGYLKAVCKPQVVDLGQSVRIVVSVEEGSIYRIGKIEAKGVRTVSAQKIIEKFQINTDDIANGEKISRVIYEELRKENCTQEPCGYSAEIVPIFRATDNERKESIVDLIIHVDENVMFNVRRVEFSGNAYARDMTLRREMLLQEGDIFVYSQLRESINRLNSLDLFEPIDFDKDVDLCFERKSENIETTDLISSEWKLNSSENNSSARSVDFAISVREKAGIENFIYYIRSIKFEFEEKKISENKLRKLLLIKEGSVFDEEMLEASVQKLNASGLVEKIDRYNNVRVELLRKENRTNPDRLELDITIFVEKIGK